jgi:hypothetical protein
MGQKDTPVCGAFFECPQIKRKKETMQVLGIFTITKIPKPRGADCRLQLGILDNAVASLGSSTGPQSNDLGLLQQRPCIGFGQGHRVALDG